MYRTGFPIIICFIFWKRIVLVSGQTSLVIPLTTDCRLTSGGREYAGPLNVTETGIPCQAWNTDTPHNHPYKRASDYPEGDLTQVGNKCRNPDSQWNENIWCYTTNRNIRWQHCSLPFCECRLAADVLGSIYQGRIQRTITGNQCKRWSLTPYNNSQMFPDRTISDASNLCRNPNGTRSGGPWCYTTNPNTEWEYCMVPVCNITSPVFTTTATTRPPTTTRITRRTTTTTTTLSPPTTTRRPRTSTPVWTTTSTQGTGEASRPGGGPSLAAVVVPAVLVPLIVGVIVVGILFIWCRTDWVSRLLESARRHSTTTKDPGFANPSYPTTMNYNAQGGDEQPGEGGLQPQTSCEGDGFQRQPEPEAAVIGSDNGGYASMNKENVYVTMNLS